MYTSKLMSISSIIFLTKYLNEIDNIVGYLLGVQAIFCPIHKLFLINCNLFLLIPTNFAHVLMGRHTVATNSTVNVKLTPLEKNITVFCIAVIEKREILHICWILKWNRKKKNWRLRYWYFFILMNSLFLYFCINIIFWYESVFSCMTINCQQRSQWHLMSEKSMLHFSVCIICKLLL